MTAPAGLRVVVAASPQVKRGAAGAAGWDRLSAAGCVEGLWMERVLRSDGPFGPEGCGLPWGNEFYMPFRGSGERL